MGKKKIDNMKFVEDNHVRTITYHLRKRGLLKKCIELSSMCGQEVYLFIHDTKRDKVVEYQSSGNFDLSQITAAIDRTRHKVVKQIPMYKSYTNQNYYDLITKKQKEVNKKNGTWFGPNTSDEEIKDEDQKDELDIN